MEGSVVGICSPLPAAHGLQMPHLCLPSPEQALRLGKRLGRHGRNQDARSPSDLDWALLPLRAKGSL